MFASTLRASWLGLLLGVSFCVALATVSAQDTTGSTTVDDHTKYDLDFLDEPHARSKFEPEDFVGIFDVVSAETPSGDVRPFTVKQRPVLATLPGEGVAQNLVTVGACAINQPHSHPRGTELSFITKGKLLFSFLEENPSDKSGGRRIGANMTEGQTIVIPQGLIHWAINVECEDAQFVASFPGRDPGTQTTLRAMFSENVADVVLRATTGLDDETIKKVRAAVAANPSPSVDPECIKRCNMEMPVYEEGKVVDEYYVEANSTPPPTPTPYVEGTPTPKPTPPPPTPTPYVKPPTPPPPPPNAGYP